MEKEKQRLLKMAALADDGILALFRQLTDLEDEIKGTIADISNGLSQYAKISDVTDLTLTVEQSVECAIDSIKALQENKLLTLEDRINKSEGIYNTVVSSIRDEIKAFKDLIESEYRLGLKEVYAELSRIKSPQITGSAISDASIELKIADLQKQILSLPSTQALEGTLTDKILQLHEGFLSTNFELEKKIIQLEKEISRYKTWPVGGGSSGIKQIVAGTGVSVDNSNLGYPVVSSSGGTPVPPTSGVVDGVTVSFIFSSKPTLIVTDGITFRENHGWTWNSGTSTVTVDNPPTFDLFAL